ncbi:glycosyltransferase family 2 protein [Pedobacter sandarakinus]|uniref:glycosyltransferase family 2 protein n=1 Tax=Pedobacter sandarakinus TaxID=353156 RepID=UPI0022462A97|nr:glycosyltransferase family 2 protein [Pedobacter sandarakinus]MCX2575943.1 glycosyltransferase family 2 protein [Pedobacter sandarakinus]
MKISIITVVYNGEKYLRKCIESIIAQEHVDIEYIVIDGKSTDGTLAIINEYKCHISHFLSEKDRGLYDAINKGIELSTGDVIGILNSDDMLASSDVLGAVARVFQEDTVDAVYGDLNYVSKDNAKVIRKWRSMQAGKEAIERGWMPAHPTLYINSKVYKAYGKYALDMGTAADYDLILRYFYVNEIKALHLPKLMVNMRMGGVSNRGMPNLIAALKNDYKALKRNSVPHAIKVLLIKKIIKIKQFW